ncbi:MAG: biopolymer transporter ExbD [Gammaproteobacteria bacterium]|nr:MAG: biopolymer transporter ExbD [Gammaproteobacteria bacterium]
MAAMIEQDQDEILAQINIIPFVDIVLVLLIIFMLTSAAIVKASLKVDLPNAASAGAGVESTLNIVYTLDQELFLNGNPTTRTQMAEQISKETETNPEVQAVISADTALPYGEVVGIIDLVKMNGVRTFALNIERDLAPRDLSSRRWMTPWHRKQQSDMRPRNQP